MITEAELSKFIQDLLEKDDYKPLISYTGKGGVRSLARAMFGPNYTFKQLISLFRNNTVSGYKFYKIVS